MLMAANREKSGEDLTCSPEQDVAHKAIEDCPWLAHGQDAGAQDLIQSLHPLSKVHVTKDELDQRYSDGSDNAQFYHWLQDRYTSAVNGQSVKD
jgi:hypothetical protein